MFTKQESRFIAWGTATLIALFLLIIAGGVVRSSGSGMGCPDWPRCFGKLIPPVNVSELPANYKEIYAARGYAETDFNVLKTWTEYINRLIGAITGFLLLIATAFAYRLKNKRSVFYLCLSALIITGFQAWLGGKVVETNLKATIVTIHMLLALVIFALVITALLAARSAYYKSLGWHVPEKKKKYLHWGLGVLLTMLLIQISKGTQVRELVDETAHSLGMEHRDKWIELIGRTFIQHRTFSWIILSGNILFFLSYIRNLQHAEMIKKVLNSALILVFLQIISGVVLAYFALPPVFQTIHLVLSTLLFGVQFYGFGLMIFCSEKKQDRSYI